MSLIEISSSPVVLRLNRDLVRTIKRGHPWVYADALRELPPAPPGRPAVLLDNKKGQPVARGFYDPGCPVALRICETDPELKLDDRWAERKLRDAIGLRSSFFNNELTTGFRLLNGEGDGVPGLVIDVYGDTAVLKLDGDGPSGFWKSDEIANWLVQERQLACVYERQKERGADGRVVWWVRHRIGRLGSWSMGCRSWPTWFADRRPVSFSISATIGNSFVVCQNRRGF